MVARPHRLVLVVALASALLVSSAAAKPSDPLKCQREVLDETARFFKARTEALRRCEEDRVKGKYDGVCPDPGAPKGAGKKAADKIVKAAEKLRSGIDKACGGDDKRCGTADDAENPFTAAGIGFASCPSLDGACARPIEDCGDVADCVECIGEGTVDALIAGLYADLVTSDPKAEKALNKCQVAIGKETAAYALAKEKALKKCWDARYKGKHTATCPDVNADPKAAKDAVKAAAAIAKAESKKIAKICKACGGGDKQCDDPVATVNPGLPASLQGSGGGDDLAPAAITAAPACPSVLLPAQPGRAARVCARPLATLADLVFCADCLTEFEVDCLDPARVPALDTYPMGECATGICPETDLGSALPVSQAGSTSPAADELTASCGSGALGPERLFRWTPPATNRYQISTVDAATNFDTVLHVRDLNCAGPEVACNDDRVGEQSRVNLLPATGGRSLGIIVDGYGPQSTGNFVLSITQLPAAGDCCSSHANNPGCNASACESCVCGQDADCCDVEWDATCAARAANQCGATCIGCAAPGTCGTDSLGQQLLCANGTCHCPFTCLGWNPPGGNCAGAPSNFCGGPLDDTSIPCTLP